MRILLLSRELVPERAGGIASYTAVIAPALAARGHDVHVLSCAPEHARSDDHHEGVWWHRRPLIGRRASERLPYRQSALRLATALSCRKELPSLGRFDVIESPEYLAESLFVQATTRTPVVVNLHTPLHILFAFHVPRFGGDLRLADLLERTAVRRSRLVTSTSLVLAEALRRDGWLRRPARIIGLPVDVEAWSSVGKIDDSPPNILVVGRLEPRKAPEVVLSAAELLAPDVRDLRVTFVGRSNGVREGKPYGDWVADLAQRFGIPARFVGQITHDRMSDMYSEARVVAVPSHFDSFSVAALEAMAAGRPVVYTSSVGAAEVLRGSGGGTEVPTNDATAMADALRPYLVDTQHAADGGRAARNIARARCSPDIIAEQRERCFEDAVDGGRREA